MLKHHKIQPRRPKAPALGGALALKGSPACIDQTQPPTTKAVDVATLRTTSQNTPAGSPSSPSLCNPRATPAPGKGARARKPGSPGRRIRNLVEEDLTPKGASPKGDAPRKGPSNRVLVLNPNHQPMMPCSPARARQLLKAGKAAILRFQPFVIILKKPVNTQTQPLQIKIDPGAKTTGLTLNLLTPKGWVVIWAAHLVNRGIDIRDALLQRRSLRRSRRNRKTRYRVARFNNRTKPKGWLPPSIQSRVQRTLTWIKRLTRWSPAPGITIEHVKFDTQLMENPKISGMEYQQGTLYGYEIRQYVLDKWGRQCVYCGKTNVPLQLDHVIPKGKGSNRASNLVPACGRCNQKKGNRTAAEFGFPHLQPKTLGLAAAAATNAIRWELVNRAKATGLPVEFGSGGRTQFNRSRQNYPKTHWIDAACTGLSGQTVRLNPYHIVWEIQACRRQRRRMVQPDPYGFPSGQAKGFSQVQGFKTGDLAKAHVSKGKKQGCWIGRVATRNKGSFRVGPKDGISYRYLTKLQHADGYQYQPLTPALSSLPLRNRVSSAIIR